jgi:nitrate reductase gamma subunit
MENTTSSIEALIEKIKSYVETTVELLKLKAIDKSLQFVSVLIAYIVVLMAMGFFIILLNIGLSFLIGELLGKVYYGFFIMAAINAIAGLIVLKNKRRWIKDPLINTMVKDMED